MTDQHTIHEISVVQPDGSRVEYVPAAEADAIRELNLELVKALREMRSMYSAYVTADGIGPALLDQADAALKHAEEVLNG